jgi:hypothetical protein
MITMSWPHEKKEIRYKVVVKGDPQQDGSARSCKTAECWGWNSKEITEEILWEERREILEFSDHQPMRRINMIFLLVRPHLALHFSALLISSFLIFEW